MTTRVYIQILQYLKRIKKKIKLLKIQFETTAKYFATNLERKTQHFVTTQE